MRAWRAGRAAGRLEVNHRIPARGAHRSLSCLHHLENLETLCVACHRVETATDARQVKQVQGAAPRGGAAGRAPNAR
jgi:5-methylcytosine-specific restriction endonuclease McrA